LTRIGSFCTSVLRTTDPDRAVAFYSALIGWTAHPAAPRHTFLKHDGKTVASIQRIDTGQDEWVPHVLVERIETAVADAKACGATLVDQYDVEGVARIATLRDLEGAAFGLWEAAPLAGAELTDVVGSIWWIELMSRDPAVGRDFYSRLFGWTVRETSFEPIGLYRVFERPALSTVEGPALSAVEGPPTQEGGLNQIDEGWDLAPVWLTFISVEDCDGTMTRACDFGGEGGFVHTVPKHGRIGMISDPSGAALWLRGPVPAV
jgi:predicted enzyme related to lactoylglutathione lyase